jgi:hypothetical protein
MPTLNSTGVVPVTFSLCSNIDPNSLENQVRASYADDRDALSSAMAVSLGKIAHESLPLIWVAMAGPTVLVV